MKRIIQGLLSIGLLFALVLGIAACNSSSAGSSNNDSVAGVYFEETNIVLAMEETYQLTAKNAGKKVTWSSNDDTIVKVDGNGVLTPVGVGVTIVKANDGKSVALCRVEIVMVRVESVLNILVNKSALLLREGDSYTLTASVKDASETIDCALEWISANKNIVTVDNGVVAAVGVGTTEIIVKAAWNGKTAEERIAVEVSAATPVLFFELDNEILQGEEVALSVKLMERSTELAIDPTQVVYSCEDTTNASFTGHSIIGEKKGYVTLSASYTYEGVTYTVNKELRIREQYTVYYEVDGKIVYSQSVLDGDDFIATVTEPTKTGYLFRFWQVEGVEYDFDTPVEEDVVLQARWLAPQMHDGDDYRLSVFGAYVENNDGYTANATKSGANIAYISSGADVQHTVYLPRVNYSEYAKVEFTFTASGWAGIGYNGQNISHGDMDGTLTITNNGNNSYSLSMKQNVTVQNVASTYTYTGTLTLANDADIIHGISGVPLIWHVYVGGRNVVFSMPTFSKDFAKLDENKTYLEDVYGSNLQNLTSGRVDSPSVDEDGTMLTYQPDVSGATMIITLPRIDYSQYAKVEFAFSVRDWTWIGLNDGAKGIVGDNDDKGGNGTLVVTNENGTYKVTMTLPDGSQLFADLTDQDIIHGKKGLTLIMIPEAIYRYVRIQLPVFTMKEE